MRARVAFGRSGQAAVKLVAAALLLAACTGPLRLWLEARQTLRLEADGSRTLLVDLRLPPTHLAIPGLRRLLDEAPLVRVAGEPLRWREVIRDRALHLLGEARFRRLDEIETRFATVALGPRGEGEAELVVDLRRAESFVLWLKREAEQALRSPESRLPPSLPEGDPRLLLPFLEEAWATVAFELPGPVIEASPFDFRFAEVEPKVEGSRVAYDLPVLYLASRGEAGGRLVIRFRSPAPVRLAIAGAPNPELRCRFGEEAACRELERAMRAALQHFDGVASQGDFRAALTVLDDILAELPPQNTGLPLELAGLPLELAQRLLDLAEDPAKPGLPPERLAWLWKTLAPRGDRLEQGRRLLLEARGLLLDRFHKEIEWLYWRGQIARAYARLGRSGIGIALLPRQESPMPDWLLASAAQDRAEFRDIDGVLKLLAAIPDGESSDRARALAFLALAAGSQPSDLVELRASWPQPVSAGWLALWRAAVGDLEAALEALTRLEQPHPATALVGIEAWARCRDDRARAVLAESLRWLGPQQVTARSAESVLATARLAHLLGAQDEAVLRGALAEIPALAERDAENRDAILAALAAHEFAVGDPIRARSLLAEIEFPWWAVDARVEAVLAFGWIERAKSRRDSACLLRLAEADSFLLERFPLLSQRDPQSYRDPDTAQRLDCADPTRPTGAREPIERLAGLATVHAMIARGLGVPAATVEDFRPAPTEGAACGPGTDSGALPRLAGVAPAAEEPLDWAAVERELRAGRPVLLWGSGGPAGRHVVLAVGLGRDERGGRTVLANDPWPGLVETRASERIAILAEGHSWVHPRLFGVRFATMQRLEPRSGG